MIIFLIYVYVCMCPCVNGHTQGGQERTLGHLELDLQAVDADSAVLRTNSDPLQGQVHFTTAPFLQALRM